MSDDVMILWYHREMKEEAESYVKRIGLFYNYFDKISLKPLTYGARYVIIYL